MASELSRELQTSPKKSARRTHEHRGANWLKVRESRTPPFTSGASSIAGRSERPSLASILEPEEHEARRRPSELAAALAQERTQMQKELEPDSP